MSKKHIRAYCYAGGIIEFGEHPPEGTIPIAVGPPVRLRTWIDAVARHGYTTEIIDGRPTKVKGTDTLLVPGIPEAPDQGAALDALHAFLDWIGEKPPKGVTVL